MKLKITLLTLFMGILFFPLSTLAQHEHGNHQEEKPAQQKAPLSPPDSSVVYFGSDFVKINYSSPRVRERVIWGGVVSYNRVWVTGAHKATTIETSSDIIIEGNELPAGKYAIFTIPQEDKWIVIFNKNADQHLSDDYDESEDLFRIEADLLETDQVKEELTFAINPITDVNGFLTFVWGKRGFSLLFAIQN